MTTFTADLSPTHSTFTRLRAGIAGAMLAEFFGTFVLVLLGLGTCTVNTVGLPGSGRQTVPFGPDNWLINVFGWAAMMRTPEPGLAPVPTTAAAWGVAGPVTAEDSAEAEKDQAA